jgi:Transposase, Mutator family
LRLGKITSPKLGKFTAPLTRLDRKATSLSVLVASGVRGDGQKVLIALRNMRGESEAAWRAVLDDLPARGLAAPELVIIDGAAGLEKAIAVLWNEYRFSAAPCTSIATCWFTRRRSFTTRSAPTTPT